ncbi:class I SAM-dependent methyltransferase [Bacteriovoracaceae bacterium]|nr:class I SAM-dependent methyltransferase [Bacteriovoracaceae bacterium]
MMLKITLLITILSVAYSTVASQNRKAVNPKRFELLSGIRNPKKDEKVYWDKKYSNTQYLFGKRPAEFLAKNFQYIPEGARVLDLGMGEGRNAVFLARKGYKVTGVDISSVAVKKSKMLAREFGVRIDTLIADLEKHDFKKGQFDAVICFYYVDKKLHDRMLGWLKPGGVLIYEAHTYNQRNVSGNEQYNTKYLLQPGELLKLFPEMDILKYEEPLHRKEYTTSIILKKPTTKL